MQLKERKKLYAELRNAKDRYDKLHAIFDGMKERAGHITKPDFELGITFAEGPAFRVSFLNCIVQFRFIYDRKDGMGIVVVEDISDARADFSDMRKVAVELWRFTFNGNGIATDLTSAEPGDHDPFNLYETTDCGQIVAAALDSALDRGPPKPQSGAVGFLT